MKATAEQQQQRQQGNDLQLLKIDALSVYGEAMSQS
jgi:hypothetical protein